jgi:hypothetical protein
MAYPRDFVEAETPSHRKLFLVTTQYTPTRRLEILSLLDCEGKNVGNQSVYLLSLGSPEQPIE